MGVVFDEGFFNEEREVVFGKAERPGFFGFLGEAQRDGVRDIRDEATVLLVEDIFLFPREEQVR